MSEEKKGDYLEENATEHEGVEENEAAESAVNTQTTEESKTASEEAVPEGYTGSKSENVSQNIETPKVEKTSKKKSLGKRILSGGMELLLYVMIAVVCIFVVPRYVVQRTQVSGPSMEATLQNKDNILVEKLSYRFGEPERFDIVVFYHFYDEDIRDKDDEDCYDFYVKRIIGLPGEKVQIVPDENDNTKYTIYINDEPLEEHYGKDPITYQGVASEPIVLDEGEYFVLGDNRAVSQDSRYEEVGNIREEDIVGKAWLRIYPFSKFGFLND